LWHCIPLIPEAGKRQNGAASLPTLSLRAWQARAW
jgi:hypothetical protein